MAYNAQAPGKEAVRLPCSSTTHSYTEEEKKGGIQITNAETRDKIVWTPGLRAVIRGSLVYILTENRLQALNRDVYVEFMRLRQKKKKDGGRGEALRRTQRPQTNLGKVGSALPSRI